MIYADFFVTIKKDSTVVSEYKDVPKRSKLKLAQDLENGIQDLRILSKREKIKKDEIEDLGDELWKSLFKDECKDQFEKAMEEVARQKAGLRISLKTELAKYADYPWEVMRYNGSYLATDIKTPFIRIFPGTTKSVELEGKLPRILTILSSTPGDPGVAIQKEKKNLKECYEKNKANISDFKDVELATRAEIMGELDSARTSTEESRFNIIHFLGHGIYKENEEKNRLRLYDEENDCSDDIDGSDLRELLKNEPFLGLIILNACYSAKITNSFAGLVPELLQIVPAVIGMRQPIHRVAAEAFTKGFYSNLLRDNLEETMQWARSKMFHSRGKSPIDFSIPVLYMACNEKTHNTAEKIFKNTINETVVTPLSYRRDELPVMSLLKLHDYYKEIVRGQLETVNNITRKEDLEMISPMLRNVFPGFRERVNKLKTGVCNSFRDASTLWSKECDSLNATLKNLDRSIAKLSLSDVKKFSEKVQKDYRDLEWRFAIIAVGNSEGK